MPFLSDLNCYSLAAVGCGGFHERTNRLCNFAMAPNYHAHIVRCNREGQLNIVAVDLLGNRHAVGRVNNCARDVSKNLLVIHIA